jgi:hypothetical protein
MPVVHLITYAAPTTKNMLHFCGLSYYALPSLPNEDRLPDWLPIELGLLAARLYFDAAEYGPLVKYLNLTYSPGDDTSASPCEQSVISADGLSAFLWDWLTIRRKGQDITLTPMGYICQARPLDESHPFFRATEADVGERWGISERTITRQADEAEDSDTDHEYD